MIMVLVLVLVLALVLALALLKGRFVHSDQPASQPDLMKPSR